MVVVKRLRKRFPKLGSSRVPWITCKRKHARIILIVRRVKICLGLHFNINIYKCELERSEFVIVVVAVALQAQHVTEVVVALWVSDVLEVVGH